MDINLHGVTVRSPQNSQYDYIIDFYKNDYTDYQIRQLIPDHYVIRSKETAEGGELVFWKLKKK